MEIMEKSMGRAVIFDLYETLITENYPEWHVEVPASGKRLGLAQEDFEREWSARYQARMAGRLRHYSDVLREICCACQFESPEEEISLNENTPGLKIPMVHGASFLQRRFLFSRAVLLGSHLGSNSRDSALDSQATYRHPASRYTFDNPLRTSLDMILA